MFATAAESTDRWVLLEVPGGWAKKAPLTPGLPEAVTTTWQRVSATPRARMQFIKHGRPPGAERTLYVGYSGPDPWWVELTLPSLDAVADVDFDALWRGDFPDDVRPVDEPLYLVCTHGKRDECCARYGMAVYKALCAHASKRVWQASHIGGHRFAATLLAFPTGHCFGRITPDQAEALFVAYENDALFSLEHVRGRTSFSRAEQAADHLIRVENDWRALDEIQLKREGAPRNVEGEGQGGQTWSVGLHTPSGPVDVDVRATPGELIYASCFKTDSQHALRWSAQKLPV